MKLIILAGGLSSRLYPITKNTPKCILDINGKSIIQRQLDSFSYFNINEMIVVTGHCGQAIKEKHPDFKYIHDNNYKTPGIVRGFFCAEKEMDNGFIFSYSDIIYGTDTVKKLLETEGDIVIATDIQWKKKYEGRTKHPLNEAELLTANEYGNVTKIGKNIVGVNEVYGEFIGLAKFTPSGVKIIKKVYHNLIKQYNKEEPFQNAPEFQRAYLTDFIQELVDRNIKVKSADISYPWSEIDTDEDLEKSREIWK